MLRINTVFSFRTAVFYGLPFSNTQGLQARDGRETQWASFFKWVDLDKISSQAGLKKLPVTSLSLYVTIYL